MTNCSALHCTATWGCMSKTILNIFMSNPISVNLQCPQKLSFIPSLRWDKKDSGVVLTVDCCCQREHLILWSRDQLSVNTVITTPHWSRCTPPTPLLHNIVTLVTTEPTTWSQTTHVVSTLGKSCFLILRLQWSHCSFYSDILQWKISCSEQYSPCRYTGNKARSRSHSFHIVIFTNRCIWMKSVTHCLNLQSASISHTFSNRYNRLCKWSFNFLPSSRCVKVFAASLW